MEQSVKIIFGEKVVGDDTIEIQLIFEYNNGSSIVEKTAEDVRVKITNYGNLELQFDMNDYLLVPSSYHLQIGDLDNYLENKVFSPNEYNLEITCKVFINSELEFEGKHTEESILYDDKHLDLEFTSNTNILFETMLFDSSGGSKNPIGLGSGVGNSSSLNEAIHDCYRLINSNIVFEVNHDWNYYGITHYVTGTQKTLYDGTWSELYTNYDEFYNGESLGDTLIALAKRKFAFTGVVNNSNAFFQKLYYYNENNLQSLNIKKCIRGIGYPKLLYVATKNADGSVLFELPDKESYINVSDKSLEIPITWIPGQVTNDWIFRNGDYYYTEQMKDNILGSTFYPPYEIQPRLHYHHRNTNVKNWLDTLIHKGLSVNYLKNFHYENRKYQILSLNKLIEAGTTNIEALYLGEVT